MTASKMLNFRVKDIEKGLIDKAAELSGLTRSDFIKAWVMKGVNEMGVTAPGRQAPTQKTAPKTPKASCPHPVESRTRTPYGVNVCTICGTKLR